MKMKSCAHWNYGYYGPIKGCMIGKTCKCEDYERRSTAKKRAASHRTIVADKVKAKTFHRQPLGVSKGFIKSKKCTHELIEKVDRILIKYCAYGNTIKNLPDGCPRRCPYKEPPVK